MSILDRLPRRVRYAIFALPMVAVLALGAFYLVYATAVCDPLYADDPRAAGYDSPSGMSVLRPLLPPDFEPDNTIPTPPRHFGVSCP